MGFLTAPGVLRSNAAHIGHQVITAKNQLIGQQKLRLAQLEQQLQKNVYPSRPWQLASRLKRALKKDDGTLEFAIDYGAYLGSSAEAPVVALNRVDAVAPAGPRMLSS